MWTWFKGFNRYICCIKIDVFYRQIKEGNVRNTTPVLNADGEAGQHTIEYTRKYAEAAIAIAKKYRVGNINLFESMMAQPVRSF